MRVVCYEKELLLYAQRHRLVEWFSDFDPTLLDQLDDFDRPWDYDHIMPSHYVSGKHNFPPLIRDLHGTIGNLRAWPLELNRSDGSEVPRQKLELPKDRELESKYNLNDGAARREASIIDEENWFQWMKASPDRQDQRISERYLSLDYKNECSDKCRRFLVTAIMTRCVFIYRRWYEDLRIDRLFKIE
jgi:hypothetical protein